MKFRTAAIAALALSAALALTGCSQSTDANDADAMFASMMIVHHEQAMEMSDIILAKDDTDATVVTLAEDIKTAQGPEIEQLQGWLEDWGIDPDDQEMEPMDHGDGMMSAEDLAALEAASGRHGSEPGR